MWKTWRQICLAAMEHGQPGETYNVSDGHLILWNEICATAQQRWSITAAAANENPSPGKRISNAKLRAELDYRFQHPDLYEALAYHRIRDTGTIVSRLVKMVFQQGREASQTRRRTLRGTLRISTSRERRWGPFSQAC